MKRNKKSQSEVVTSVLLILIVIASIFIVISFVIPFVKNQLKTGDCFKVVGYDKLRIENNEMYTCYNSSSKNLSVQVHVGDIVDQISGFTISLGGASTNTYTIKNNTETSGVTMSNGAKTLVLPGQNQERTYIIIGVTSNPDNIKIYPILIDGKSCDSTNGINEITICGT